MQDGTRPDDPYAPVQGSLEEGRALLHVRSATNHGAMPVSDVRIAQYCGLIEDGNPSYWDRDQATRIWGRPVAPPAMLQVWVMPLPWAPGVTPRPQSMMMDLPLPADSLVNISTDISYHRPIFEGEKISFWDEATEISEEKTTRLGTGFFVTTLSHFFNQDGEEVATGTNVQFRFRRTAA